MLYDDTAILLFAKAPVAGQVNTRLIPDIGVQAATELQHELIHQRLAMLKNADLCAVYLMCAPGIEHHFFIECAQQYPVTLVSQCGDDLGARMLDSTVKALRNYDYCIVIGTDAPVLDGELIGNAIAELKTGASVVFVPAEDGGYVLIGMHGRHDYLFKNINWGSPEVMQQSRYALDARNMSYQELDTCWDIDRLEDYQRYLEFRRAHGLQDR